MHPWRTTRIRSPQLTPCSGTPPPNPLPGGTCRRRCRATAQRGWWPGTRVRPTRGGSAWTMRSTTLWVTTRTTRRIGTPPTSHLPATTREATTRQRPMGTRGRRARHGWRLRPCCSSALSRAWQAAGSCSAAVARIQNLRKQPRLLPTARRHATDRPPTHRPAAPKWCRRPAPRVYRRCRATDWCGGAAGYPAAIRCGFSVETVAGTASD